MKTPTARVVATLTLFVGLAFPATTVASGGGFGPADGLDAVRDATRAFRDVDAATAARYAILAGTPLEECVDEPGEGTMGFHYVNGDLVGDAIVEPTTPEALLYVPRPDGSLRLVGVEYVVFADAWDAENDEPPSLFGQQFHLVSEPNRYELPPFYELHAWAWASNPSGTFNDWNPNVSCHAELPDTATAALGERPGMPVAPPLGVVVAIAAGCAAAFLLRGRLRART